MYIVQYWHEADPPDYIVELLASFARQNPGMEHLVFDRAMAREFIAEHCGARELAAFEACAVPAMQADYFRYCAGYVLGGVCADADCRCLRPLRPLLEQPHTRGIVFMARDALIANGFFGFRQAGHPLLEMARETATELIHRRVEASVPAVTGPGLFTCLYCLNRVGSLDAARRFVADGIEPPAGSSAVLAQLRNLVGNGSALSAEIVRVACAAAGSDERLAEAFAGVRTPPRPVDLIEHVDAGAMHYKSTRAHWPNAGDAVYVEAR
jgi:hypothetical protein